MPDDHGYSIARKPVCLFSTKKKRIEKVRCIIHCRSAQTLPAFSLASTLPLVRLHYHHSVVGPVCTATLGGSLILCLVFNLGVGIPKSLR